MISFVICNLSNFLCFGQFDDEDEDDDVDDEDEDDYAAFRSFRSIRRAISDDRTGDPRRRGSIARSIVKTREGEKSERERRRERTYFSNETETKRDKKKN